MHVNLIIRKRYKLTNLPRRKRVREKEKTWTSESRELRGADGRSETPQGRHKQRETERERKEQEYSVTHSLAPLLACLNSLCYLNLDRQQCSIMLLVSARATVATGIYVFSKYSKAIIRYFSTFEAASPYFDNSFCQFLIRKQKLYRFLTFSHIFVNFHRFF